MTDSNLQSVVLGGGCFWCIEAAFSHCKGVKEAISGYSGGERPDPSYEQVCTGVSGHAEVVKVVFDPTVITLDDVLHIFFSVHDPTTMNRQGADVGTQYRSVIFYNSPEQEKAARAVIAEIEAEKIFDHPVVTEVLPLEKFYQAEAYHQKYYENNPEKGYCQVIIAPKLVKFKQKYKHFYTE